MKVSVILLGLVAMAIYYTNASRRLNVGRLAKRLKSRSGFHGSREELKAFLELRGGNNILRKRSFKTALGRIKERLQQTYGDLEVVGGGISADYTPTRGYTGTVSGELFASLEEDIPNPDICNQPEDVVMGVAFKGEGITASEATNIRVKKNVFIEKGKACLTYEINFFYMDGHTPSRPCYFVNACDLNVVYKFNNIQHKALHKREEELKNRVQRQSPGDSECPAETTTQQPVPEVTTEETLPEATTKETLPEATTEETLPEATTEETIPEATTEETIPEATTEETIPEATTEETIPEATTEETIPEATTEETIPEATTEETLPEATTEETLPEATTEETIPEATTQETPKQTTPSSEITTADQCDGDATTPEVTTEETTPETTTEETIPEATTEESIPEATTPDNGESLTTPGPLEETTTTQVTCTNPARGEGGNQKVGRTIYGVHPLCLNTTVTGTTCILENDYVQVIDLKQSTNRNGRSAATYTCSQGYDDAINGAFSPVLDAMHFGTASARMFIEWYGMTALSFKPRLFCHYGRRYENAFWDGSSLTFGDGQTTFYPLVNQDVVAHELAHGVTNQNSDLIYDNQSGGINEAFSDMAGEATEMFARGSNDWLMGAEIFKSSSGALRYFEDPTRDRRSLKHVRDYNDNVDVHYSSGIFNHAFYQMVEKNKMPMKQAFHCFLYANLNYWGRNTTFEEGACDVMRACYDLGFNFQAVKRSFQVVGITFADCVEPSFMEALSASETLNDVTVSSSRTPVFVLEPPQGSTRVTVTASASGSINMAVYDDLESGSPLMTGVGEMVYQLSPSSTSSLYLRLSADTDMDISGVTLTVTYQ